MKNTLIIILLIISTLSCENAKRTDVKEVEKVNKLPLVGTWELISGTLIEKGDTTVTNYQKGKRFIKIINDTHFAFVLHDLNKGKDSTKAEYSSGAGTYTLKDSLYTEFLEFCTAREWEDHKFEFVVSIKNDTLIQQGVEKIEKLGVNRVNIEKYRRVKK
jgi:hypothetical protein